MKNGKHSNRLICLVTSHPKTCLFICFVFFAYFAYQIKFLQSNFSARMWYDENAPEIISLNNFEKRFGGDEFLVLGIKVEKSIFTQENLNFIKDLTKKLWLLPNVLRIDSLANTSNISFIDDEINIDNLIPDNFKSPKEIEKKAMQIEEIQNVLINKKKDFTLFHIKLKPSLGKNPDYDPFMSALRNLLQTSTFKDHQSFLLGPVGVSDAFKSIGKADNERLMPILFLLVIVVLGFYFRSLAGVFTPLLIVIFSTVEAFGFMSLMGYVFNSVLGAIPGVLLGICLADSIHVFTLYYQQVQDGWDNSKAIEYSLTKNFLPTILTTVTTVVSFISISFTELVPIHDLGLVAAFGATMAWFNTYILVPGIIQLSPLFVVKQFNRHQKDFRFDLTPFILKRKTPITLIFLIISITSFYFATKNEANSDPLKYFDKETKIRKDFQFAEDQMGSIRGVDLVIDAKELDGAKDPVFLKTVEKYSEEILKLPYITKVRSVIDVIKKMNENLNNGNEKYRVIPNSKALIAETLFVYSLSLPPGLGLENQISFDNRFIKLRINWIVDSTKDSVEKVNTLHKMAKDMGLSSKTGGNFGVYSRVNDHVVNSFFRSIIMALISVGLILLIVFRDPLLALLAMLPNIIPLLIVGAYTAIAHIYIDVGASIVFTICLGIAVDDTIHFISHYKYYRNQGYSLHESLSTTFLSSGEAIILTTLVLIIGFGSFVFADFIPNKNFGVLSAAVLFFAVITDLVFLPSVLSLFNKKVEAHEAN